MQQHRRQGGERKFQLDYFYLLVLQMQASHRTHIENTCSTTHINYPPVGDYSSYTVTVNPNGSYSVDYKGHDPTVLDSESIC